MVCLLKPKKKDRVEVETLERDATLRLERSQNFDYPLFLEPVIQKTRNAKSP